LPEGSPFGDVWQLSYARCQATLKYLQEQGIEPQRMRLSQAGPYEPEAQPDTADWTTHHSRVVVYMLGEYVSDTKKPRKSKGARVGELGARH
jgi:flagellar motor protein MotB